MVKIHILFNIMNKPSGGGNNFLSSLKKYLISMNSYEENINDAHAILFNSHHLIHKVVKLKKMFPDKVFIHRIDGPMRLYNTFNDKRDLIVNTSNEFLADATIFQSEWSKKQSHQMGLKKNLYETVILNAPDNKIFNRNMKEPFLVNRRLRLVASSWSSNIKKGFKVYEWLDNNLDFQKFEMTFVGDSPITFNNIRCIPTVASKELSHILKKNDIYITASQNDPCSNSLIEAMHCGLPAVALKEGGHIEIIRKGGELFCNVNQLKDCLDKVINNYEEYQKNIDLPDINQVGHDYVKFISYINRETIQKKYAPKKVSQKGRLKIFYLLLMTRVKSYFNNFF